jgi:hypothetical protein
MHPPAVALDGRHGHRHLVERGHVERPPYARYGAIVLGVLPVIYAIVGLSNFSFSVARSNEKWIGGIVGLLTGMVSATTGVQVVPSMPFMQAIGMEKDELVQALGVFFTVATLALAFTLTSARLARRIDGAAGRGGDGERHRRHVHRPGGALADAAGSLPPLVPDRDDFARALSREQRGLQYDGVVTSSCPDLIRASIIFTKRLADRWIAGSSPAMTI